MGSSKGAICIIEVNPFKGNFNQLKGTNSLKLKKNI
jgi:hypothetical protein